MKFKVACTALYFLAFHIGLSQEVVPKPKGEVTGKVFFNYHMDETEDAEQTSAFELTRAYLGYKYTFDDKFSATMLLDAGKGSGASNHSIFIKNAKLDFKADSWITFSAGIFGMKQYNDQEKFWGYRYLYKSLGDEYKFGTSADLGAMASVKISDDFKMDVLVVNGEGYKKLQDASGKTRFGLNMVYTPNTNWVFKAYYDTMKGVDVDDDTKITTVNNIALFAGYKIDNHFRIGAEYNLMQNGITYKDPAKDKDLKGLSFYSAYIINKKWNVFGRYDMLSSNKLSEEIEGWNFSDDGNTIISGFEFKPTKGINTSVNYRFTDFEDDSKNNASLIYFNLEFYF